MLPENILLWWISDKVSSLGMRWYLLCSHWNSFLSKTDQFYKVWMAYFDMSFLISHFTSDYPIFSIIFVSNHLIFHCGSLGKCSRIYCNVLSSEFETCQFVLYARVIMKKKPFTSLKTSPALVLLHILPGSNILIHLKPRFWDSRLKSSSADLTDIKISQWFVRV